MFIRITQQLATLANSKIEISIVISLDWCSSVHLSCVEPVVSCATRSHEKPGHLPPNFLLIVAEIEPQYIQATTSVQMLYILQVCS